MISCHGGSPIFFNKKKNKDGTAKTLANPPPPPTPTSNNISFLPHSPPPSPILKVDVICVSLLINFLKSSSQLNKQLLLDQ